METTIAYKLNGKAYEVKTGQEPIRRKDLDRRFHPVGTFVNPKGKAWEVVEAPGCGGCNYYTDMSCIKDALIARCSSIDREDDKSVQYRRRKDLDVKEALPPVETKPTEQEYHIYLRYYTKECLCDKHEVRRKDDGKAIASYYRVEDAEYLVRLLTGNPDADVKVRR